MWCTRKTGFEAEENFRSGKIFERYRINIVFPMFLITISAIMHKDA